MKDPADHHMKAVIRLMKYIRSTIKLRIKYSSNRSTTLVMYSDADWAGQKHDRKSTSGSAGMLCGGAITWSSRVQRSVATSSTESEYMAMSGTAKTSQWVAQVLRDMGYSKYIGRTPSTVDIRGDNQGALALVKNPHLHERLKHIDICYHHIRDLAERRRIEVTYIPTDEIVADGFTKPVLATAFQRFRDMLGMEESRSTSSQ